MDGWNSRGEHRPRIWLCCVHGEDHGIGLAEATTTLVGSIERSLTQRVAQPGTVAGAQSLVDVIEGLSSLLVLMIGSAVQGGGDGGVAVRTDG